MVRITFDALSSYMQRVLSAAGMPEKDCKTFADIYIECSKRGVGHHDIHNFPSRIDRIRNTMINPKPNISKISGFGGMESWDGDHGTGEVLNRFAMQRAIDLASEHGIGMCTIRNSNHYLCSAPYVMQAAQQGYIGFIIAKAGCCMGLPGIEGNLIGQAPIGFAFPTAEQWPVMMDICLAYAAGEHLIMKDRLKIPVPSYWGVDKGGNPTTDAGEILKGVKFPIGEHKGFGLALLAELLTGVLSGGAILDDGDEEEIYRGTSHTSFAIKADALMSMPEYTKRSQELIDRLRNRSEKIHVPGDSSWKNIEKFDQTGYMELDEDFIDTLNRYAEEYHVEGIQKGE